MLERLVQGAEGVAPKPMRVKPSLTATAQEALVTARQGLPNDVGAPLSNEALADAAKDLRRYAATFIEIAVGLEALAGVPESVALVTARSEETERKLAEQEADRKAADREKAAQGDKRAAARVAAATAPDQKAAMIEQAQAEMIEQPTDFQADFEAKAKAAQAAVFKAPQDDTETEDPPETKVIQAARAAAAEPDATPQSVMAAAMAAGWQCPEHPDQPVIIKTSPRRGRQYHACSVADCGEFERL